MSTFSNQPVNKNFLSQLGFQFSVTRLPTTNFFVQAVTLPGINMNAATVNTPFKILPFPGDTVQYGDLSVTFMVSEDLKSYTDIFDWITGLGFPDNFGQRAAVMTANNRVPIRKVMSDASLIIHTSSMNPWMTVQIEDCFPVSLSDLTFQSTGHDVEYIEATVQFKFQNYYFKRS